MTTDQTRRTYFVELVRVHVGEGVGRWSTRFRAYAARVDFTRSDARARGETQEILGIWETDATCIAEAEAHVVEWFMRGNRRGLTVVDLTHRPYPHGKPVLVGREPVALLDP